MWLALAVGKPDRVGLHGVVVRRAGVAYLQVTQRELEAVPLVGRSDDQPVQIVYVDDGLDGQAVANAQRPTTLWLGDLRLEGEAQHLPKVRRPGLEHRPLITRVHRPNRFLRPP